MSLRNAGPSTNSILFILANAIAGALKVPVVTQIPPLAPSVTIAL
jgi:hypothetical protein